MPAILRQNGFRFSFHASKDNPREPTHPHVLRDGIDAKSWLWLDIKPPYNNGFNAKVLRELTGY